MLKYFFKIVMAVFEIIHAAFGLVKSNAVVTTMQVFSRVWVLWGIMDPLLKVQINVGCSILIFDKMS